MRVLQKIRSGNQILTRGKIEEHKWITLQTLCNGNVQLFAEKKVVEPYPGVYQILRKIMITQSASQYKSNHSTGGFCTAGDEVFIREVKKIETIKGILIRGKINQGKWITLKDLCYKNTVQYAKLEVRQFLKLFNFTLLLGHKTGTIKKLRK